jgi:hypothetical protein
MTIVRQHEKMRRLLAFLDERKIVGARSSRDVPAPMGNVSVWIAG